MEAAAAAAGLLAAITVFVFYGGRGEQQKRSFVTSTLLPRSYPFADFLAAVVSAVQPLGFDERVVREGEIFVRPKPPSGGKPSCPDGDGLFEGNVDLAPEAGVSKIVLLNLGNSVPAAAGGAAGSDLTATVSAAVRAALEERSLFDRMNPFARSHHSDSISLHTATGAARFPGSEPERVAFKQQVAEFYGLTSLVPIFMVDMFNKSHLKKNVTLAHIWPASYTNWDDPRDELALPEDFHKEPRNFLLLPRNVHEAFDHGRLIFVPSPTDITCFVLPGASVSKAIRKLHGKKLHLPKHATGGVPYKRQLAYFALRAKGRAAVDATIQAALEAAMAASADEAGNAALQEVEQRMRAINII